MSPSDQAPRSKEPKRRDLERKFLAKTLKTKGAMIPKALKRRAQKLFKPKKDLATTDLARYKDDIERRQIILKLMKKLIKAGDELPHEEAKWQRLANVDQQAYAEKEEEDRAIIINELASRVFKPLEAWQTLEFLQARKVGARLFRDTLKLPDRGGIPENDVKWLERLFEKSNKGDRKEDRQADEAARSHAVNYIAACRRETGVDEELEKSGSHEGYKFNEIDLNVTRQELKPLPGFASDQEDDFDVEDEGTDEEEGGVLVRLRSQAPSPVNTSQPIHDDDDDGIWMKEETNGPESGVSSPTSEGEWTDDADDMMMMPPEPVLASEIDEGGREH